jgi:putative hydrolase
VSDGPVDPFEHLPPELRQMLEQMGGHELFQQMQGMFITGAPDGPVDWDLARQLALQVAAEDDRPATAEEQRTVDEALRVAEHWLDGGSLPAPPDGGRLLVASRQEWVNAALTTLRPLVEPIAAASARALTELAGDQLEEADLSQLGPLAGLLGGMDLSAMLQPMGAKLTGMQAGQILGQLARQLLGQYELGLPTAPRSTAMHVAVNVDEAFGEWGLDATEVAIALTLHEAAHRRLYHAVPWLEAHLHGLVAQFANGTEVDPEQLQRMAQDLMTGVDPDDPESMRTAMARAAEFRMEPTPQQQRVLERIQGVVALIGAWARAEVRRAAEQRLPSLGRIEEVLRRRRAAYGDGEQLLQQLLGLDLKPDDETVGDRFVAAVETARGPAALRQALAHPENLPDSEELADPERWLARLATDELVPDDLSALLDDSLGEAPHEASADERQADDGDGDDGDADDGG